MKSGINRRKVLKGAIALPFLGSLLVACQESEKKPVEESAKLNILILGGTSFLGPHQIAYALERGHTVTTFTRGKTKPTIHTELFDKVTMLIGDRVDDLTALEEGEWDVVIDNSGQRVEWVRKTAELLKDRAGLYLFTSSTGVFYPYLDDDIKENHDLVMEKPEVLKFEYEHLEYDYGIMKAKSEIETIKAFGKDRSIIIRPTYMVGPGDKFDRFIHWPVRLARGGEILVPGKADDPVQYADVRDVAEFMIRTVEEKKVGTYNAAGPKEKQTVRAFADQANEAFDIESSFIYVDDYKFLEENGVQNLVPWIPPTDGNYGSARISNAAAIAAGLTFRPIADTVRETYEWWMSDALGDEKREKYETDPKQLLNTEVEIIKKWKSL